MDSYTNQLSNSFQNYLLERFDGDVEETNHVIESAESVIPDMLKDYFGIQIDSIYDLQDVEEIESLQKKVKTHPILKNIDMNAEPRYTDVLRWYRLFVRSLTADSIPVPVPGEYSVPGEGNAQVLCDNKYLPKKQRTIFTEGEDEGLITTEQRKRNMDLRKACIEIFRAKHGGRIVCECCGFDFRKAYDIFDDYIEVHHKKPFSHTEGEHDVDAENDLVPLCANCHRMIHHGQGGKGNCMRLDQLKEKYKGITYNN